MKTPSPHIDVAVALPVFHTYTYSVAKNLQPSVSVGKRVLVPFGQRTVTGYILDSGERNIQKDMKPILDVLDEDPLFPSSMIPFFRWIADYYIHPIGEVIKSALPGGLNVYDFATIAITEAGETALSQGLVSDSESKLLGLLTKGSCSYKDLGKSIGKNIPNSLIHVMERSGWIVKKRELKGGGVKSKMERYTSLIRSDIDTDGFSLPRKKIIHALKSEGDMSVAKLKTFVPTAPGLLKSLENAGYISIFKKRVYRDPFGEPITLHPAPILTGEQKNVISTVLSSLGKGFATFLLAGVTGSGKTEVYLQLAAEAMKRKYSVLVLVPEIVLISQIERRFRARFGDCVALLHSRLSAGERFDQWRRIADNEASVVIGARSAIFAPFKKIGIIIVDEEHDTSYKQETKLRYNARDLAVVRAKIHGGIALLGSATPSIQSYYNVKTKKFAKVNLSKRVEERTLPEIALVDLRKSRNIRGTRRFITSELYKSMKETLDRNEQILLFLNRRGFSSFPICGACGEAMQCKNCDISLTLHQKTNAYMCHYCGFTRASVSNCMACGSSKIRLLGLGTEKVEASVRALFPDARVARMDRDTTTRKGSMLNILKGLRNNTIDILVGTQMVAKGHDFPNITLVGIICADLSLSFPDFRAGERTFQLLAQVSGRAGRGAAPGRVILQTYNPDHFSIISAKDQDYKAFYNNEIGFRKSLNYPPFSRMIQIKISGRDREKTGCQARVIGNLCEDLKKSTKSFLMFLEIMGPIEAPLSRIARRYRWQILIKGFRVRPLHQFARRLVFENPSMFNDRNVKVAVDVDPYFMM